MATIEVPTSPEARTAKERFFVPQTQKRDYESSYSQMIAGIQDVFKWQITERRISGLVYVDGKRLITATVGMLEQFERRYEIAAIMESNLYVIITKDAKGEPGPMIMVDGKNVTRITDFPA